MGGRRDSDTLEKKVSRRISDLEGNFRVAKYLETEPVSKRIKWMGRHIVQPQAQINLLNLYVRQKDKEQFERIVRSTEVRKALSNGIRCVFLEPETAFKAFCLLLFPKLYFWARSL